jgi:hypothetical protein
LGPLATSATNRPIVSASGDYDDGEIGGMMICKGNLPQCRFVHRKPPHACPDANPGRRNGGKPATNRLSYGTTFFESLRIYRAIRPSLTCFQAIVLNETQIILMRSLDFSGDLTLRAALWLWGLLSL